MHKLINPCEQIIFGTNKQRSNSVRSSALLVSKYLLSHRPCFQYPHCSLPFWTFLPSLIHSLVKRPARSVVFVLHFILVSKLMISALDSHYGPTASTSGRSLTTLAQSCMHSKLRRLKPPVPINPSLEPARLLELLNAIWATNP